MCLFIRYIFVDGVKTSKEVRVYLMSMYLYRKKTTSFNTKATAKMSFICSFFTIDETQILESDEDALLLDKLLHSSNYRQKRIINKKEVSLAQLMIDLREFQQREGDET